MDVEHKIHNDIREEVAVLRELVDTTLRRGLAPEDEPLLRACGDTLRKRTDLLQELDRDDRTA
jgi:hypothetical protein